MSACVPVGFFVSMVLTAFSHQLAEKAQAQTHKPNKPGTENFLSALSVIDGEIFSHSYACVSCIRSVDSSVNTQSHRAKAPISTTNFLQEMRSGGPRSLRVADGRLNFACCKIVNQLRRLNLRVQISIAMVASSPAFPVETVTATSEGAATFLIPQPFGRIESLQQYRITFR